MDDAIMRFSNIHDINPRDGAQIVGLSPRRGVKGGLIEFDLKAIIR